MLLAKHADDKIILKVSVVGPHDLISKSKYFDIISSNFIHLSIVNNCKLKVYRINCVPFENHMSIVSH